VAVGAPFSSGKGVGGPPRVWGGLAFLGSRGGVPSKGYGGWGGSGPLLGNWEGMWTSQEKGSGWAEEGMVAPPMARGPGLGHVWNMSGMQHETTLARSKFLVCGRHGLMWARC